MGYESSGKTKRENTLACIRGDSMELLVTLPHGATPTGDGEHNSDTGALELLPFLEEALTAMEIEYKVMVGDVNRGILDLNRLRSHSHPWHKELREALLEAKLHIDLHSFPSRDSEDSDYLTSNGYDLRVWSQGEVVFFNTTEITPIHLLSTLEDSFQELSLQVIEEQAGYENYISAVANILMDVPSVVVEVNEAETQSYRQVGSALASGVLDFLEQYGEQPPQDDELLPVDA